jgi:class 3 adenylate cyclase/tetratricopeptide (TPR) repeat protein
VGVSICASCGRENPADAGFCNGCGAALAIATAPREQRKTVTVLFCDVTGSTAMGERLDPESLRQVMRRYFDAARRVIEHHGGSVEKFIGDAVMAVFGVPVLHEDDALRAVRAAVGLRDALADLNSELERDYGTTVTIRTGVNTGQVVTGTEERLATGDAVNLAARLEQAAAPGEIVIGPETWRLVRDAVTVEPLEPLALKGKAMPVTAYRLLQVGGGAVPRAGGFDAPLVGRDNQMRMLTNAFANVVGGRSCSLFTVLGTAGVGKSRMATEFLRDVDATVLRGRCLSYGEGITYWPVISVVKELLETAGGSGAVERMRRDENVAAAINALLGEQSATTSPSEIAWAVRKLLESSADDRPLVVVFDDLHWGEPALLDLIEHIGDLSRDAAILVLCLARPELLDRRPGWGGGKLNATTVLLEPLNAAETDALIGELLPDDSDIDPQVRSRVRAMAAGNPLFVEEMLALMRESSSHDVIVPPTIQALLAARLDQLRPDERSVLEHGSIEGQSFHRGAVQVMAPDESDISGKLMTLVRKDLVRPDRAVFAGEDAFKFRHLLIRDAAYDALSKAVRAELHECFAGWLRERSGNVAELDEITGYHLEQAFRYRAELGPVDERARGLAAAAAERLDIAGRRALDRGDMAAAVNLLERARSLTPAEELNLAREISLIWGLAMCGRLNDAISRAENVAANCSAAGDQVGELRARLTGAMWSTNVDPGSHEAQLRALVEQARPVIERSGDHAALASLEYAAGFVDYYSCRFGAALAACTRSNEHARQADESWLVSETGDMSAGAVAFGPTPIDEGLRWLENAAAESGTFRPGLDECRVTLLAYLGRFDEARSLFDQTMMQMSERGLKTWIAMSAQVAWQIEMLTGDPAAAERVAREGCEQLEQLGERAWLSTLACQLGVSLYELGRYEEAEEWALRGVELGGSHDVLTQALGLEVRSKLLARRGDYDAALSLAEQADNLAGTTDSFLVHGDAALNLAEVLHLTGNPTRAAQEIQRAIDNYDRRGASGCVARARSLAATWKRS